MVRKCADRLTAGNGAAAVLMVGLVLATALAAEPRITLERLEGGDARVRYRFDGPVEALEFRVAASARPEGWRAGEGFEVGAERVRSVTGEPFSEVTLTIAPAAPPVGEGTGPALVTVDDVMSVIDLDHVLPAAEDAPVVRVREAYDPLTQTCVDLWVADRADLAIAASRRFVAFGTNDGLCRERLGATPGRTFFPDGAPEPLVEAVTSAFEAAVERLDASPEPAPTLVLAYDGEAAAAAPALDVGWLSTVLVRLRGPGWAAPGEAQARELRGALERALATSDN